MRVYECGGSKLRAVPAKRSLSAGTTAIMIGTGISLRVFFFFAKAAARLHRTKLVGGLPAPLIDLHLLRPDQRPRPLVNQAGKVQRHRAMP